MTTDSIDQACFEIQAVAKELTSGLRAYHNACVVVNYYNTYGYTEHFQFLIGEEGLVDQAKEVIGRFVTWVKQKVSELIEKIVNLFRLIRDRLAKLLGLKKTPKELDDVVKQINISLDKAAQYMSGELIFIRFDAVLIGNKTCEASSFVYTGAADNSINRYISRTAKYIHEVDMACKELPRSISIKRSDVRDAARLTSSSIGILTSIVDTFILELRSFKDSIHENMTRDEFLDEVRSFTKCSPKSFNKELFDQEPSKALKDITDIVAIMSSATGKLTNITYSYLVKLNKTFNTDRPVHVVVKINPMLLKRLEHQFGGSLDIRNIVITNQDPQTWEVANDTIDKRPACGWCYSGLHRTGSLDLYINYRLYKKQLKAHKYDDFILTIVHECRHLFNGQHGLTESVREDEEDICRAAEQKYKAAKEDDIVWLKDVINKLREQDDI